MALRPSLVPVETVEDWPRELQGLSLRNVTLEVFDTRRRRSLQGTWRDAFYAFRGFRPACAKRKRPYEGYGSLKARYKMRIDLKPALTEQLDKRLQRT